MPHPSLHILGSLLALVIAAPVAAGQAPVRTPPAPTQEIPRNLRPPAGMCRVWLDKVPARQQPAPTDCASAIRNRPPNGRVIFSEDDRRKTPPSKAAPSPRQEKKPKKPDGSR
jgi:hypothetical protein